MLGAPVGIWLGLPDGSFVGLSDGVRDGSELRPMLGRLDGLKEGTRLGCFDGFGLRGEDRAADGLALGNILPKASNGLGLWSKETRDVVGEIETTEAGNAGP